MIQAWTGHSEAFAMELRAGPVASSQRTRSLSATSYCAAACRWMPLLDRGSNATPTSLLSCGRSRRSTTGDIFLIASNSGVNGSVVGMALLAKEKGHDVIAVTSLQHTARAAKAVPAVGGSQRSPT